MKVWIDGRVVDGSEARVPVVDHGLLYGDGVFEGIRARGGRVFRLDVHLERLATSARALGLELPGSTQLCDVVAQTLRAFGEPDAYLRLVVTRGDGALGIDPASCAAPRVICIADHLVLYPRSALERGLALVTASVRRPPPDVLDPRIKSLNYLPGVLARLEARRAGADEALILNLSGHVAEAPVANVFALRKGVLRTPPATDGALEGITRGALLELADTLGLSAHEATLGRVDLLAADEVFLSGTGAGVVPVGSLDGAPIGTGRPGPMTEKLRLAFEALARREGLALA